jgi:hypothetical protein
MMKSGLYRVFHDEFPVTLDILPEVPVYAKIEAHSKPSPWTLNFKYGNTLKKENDLMVYVSRVHKFPD